MQNNMIVVSEEEEKVILAKVEQQAGEHLAMLRRERLTFDWFEEFRPKLPWNWEVIQSYENGLMAKSNTGLKVLMTGDWKQGKRWLHVSCSRPNRIPNWDDMKRMKELFIGDDRLAIQVFPPKDQWVNINQYVLHLWVPLDGLDFPDFTEGTGSI